MKIYVMKNLIRTLWISIALFSTTLACMGPNAMFKLKNGDVIT